MINQGISASESAEQCGIVGTLSAHGDSDILSDPTGRYQIIDELARTGKIALHGLL